MISVSVLASALRAEKLDAVIVTGEKNISYLLGALSLEGLAFVTADGNAFYFTDGRYIESAERSASPLGYEVSLPLENSYSKQTAELCARFGVNTLGFEDEEMTCAKAKAFFDRLSCRMAPASFIFSRMRMYKTEEEAACIEKAQRIAEISFERLLPEIKAGMTENECKALLEYYMAQNGSEKPAFSTIFISGAKTSMPHGVSSNKKIERGDFVTVDFGAVCGGYCSDMTRTFAVGSATDEMKSVYATVLSAQLAAIEFIETGREAAATDKTARDVISSAGFGEYFSHSLGHGVGLNIHEAPNLSPSCKNTLEKGNVITVEPGIYIPQRFGVRIEDMIYLSESGKINLTKCGKELIIV